MILPPITAPTRGLTIEGRQGRLKRLKSLKTKRPKPGRTGFRAKSRLPQMGRRRLRTARRSPARTRHVTPSIGLPAKEGRDVQHVLLLAAERHAVGRVQLQLRLGHHRLGPPFAL